MYARTRICRQWLGMLNDADLQYASGLSCAVLKTVYVLFLKRDAGGSGSSPRSLGLAVDHLYIVFESSKLDIPKVQADKKVFKTCIRVCTRVLEYSSSI